MSLLQTKLTTEVGPVYLVASSGALLGVHWQEQAVPWVDATTPRAHPAAAQLARAAGELEEYFSGQRQRFSLPSQGVGTPFQQRVWQALRQIPYGETLSYKELAAKLGHRAYRAVGSANGKNPLAILVPCHRVIGADGGPGGYAGGLPAKAYLLRLESRL
jgi:methylated-DNA-[protein]-cysteine S-methyltransferase